MSTQPKSLNNLTKQEFLRIKESLIFKKKPKETHLPLDIGLFLTGRCNLRCRHCFEWNPDGFLRKAGDQSALAEMKLSHIESCLKYTKPVNSRLYLWGGEPLIYSQFHDLCRLLKEDPRWTTICTNGLLIQEHIDDLLEISENLVLLISLDGFRDYNDAIRGKGTFDKVIENIRYLQNLAEQGRYKGEVSVCCVLSDDLVPHLFDFCNYMESFHINTVYISFPWYISEDTANEMDVEFQYKYADLMLPGKFSAAANASWHNFTYHLSSDCIEVLKEEMSRIAKKSWQIRVRFQPAIAEDEIEDFVKGGTKTAQKKSTCLAPFNRVDVFENGDVSACKLFREFTVGNLNAQSIQEIWEGSRMQEMRRRVQCGLLPVCSKCVLLYLNGN